MIIARDDTREGGRRYACGAAVPLRDFRST
jgi:hypothetical protein